MELNIHVLLQSYPLIRGITIIYTGSLILDDEYNIAILHQFDAAQYFFGITLLDHLGLYASTVASFENKSG